MLVQFSTKNFGSLREKQVLRLVATTDTSGPKSLAEAAQDSWLSRHAVDTGLTAAPHVLKSAVIYGANASGKSTVINALQYMRGMVLESAAMMPGQQFDRLRPFNLYATSGSLPTEFEATFLINEVLYQYCFSMTIDRIISEELLVYKASKPQPLFTRHFDTKSGKDVYEFSPSLKVANDMLAGATRPNALFLSVAVQLNSEALLPVLDWFSSSLVILNDKTQLMRESTILLLKRPEGKKQICKFLKAAGIDISDFEVFTNEVQGRTPHRSLIAMEKTVQITQIEEHRIFCLRATEDGTAVTDLMDESGGTRRLLFMAAPIMAALKDGTTLVVDDLDANLHPILVQALVRLFHNPEVNTGGGQIIFTAHDTSLLDVYGLFRRDQVWFVENKNGQGSRLYSPIGFIGSPNGLMGRDYLQGGYGALPVLGSFSENVAPPA